MEIFHQCYQDTPSNLRTTVANQCTRVRNHASTFLSLVNKDLPVINIVFTTNIHYFWKSTDFEGVFCKSLVNIFIRNSLHKKSGGPIFTKYIALSDFKRLRLSSERWNKKPNKLLQDKMKSSVRKSWDTLMNVRLLIVRLVCLHHSSQLQISRRRY